MAVTGSVRYAASRKRGVVYPVFKAQIFNPVTQKQMTKEFSLNKYGAHNAKRLAGEALNTMRKQLLHDGHNVNFDELRSAPRNNLRI